MSFKDRLKQGANWVAAVSSAVTMQAAPLSAGQNVAQEGTAAERQTVEQLDQRVERGTIINGETQAERSARWEAYKAKNGRLATMEAIRREELKKLEIPHKDEKGYTFETYEPGKKHTFESYYPNGVLQSRNGENGEEAEGYYPDGSRKFVRTADGVETKYHPGGEKGKEKIKETPHKLYEAYDVLDEEGRRTEHHYDVANSPPQKTRDGGSYTSRDVKKVDLYDPQTQQVVGTYTLDHWHVANGRVASIGYADETGAMKTMDFPQANKIGDTNYYAPSLSLDQIKDIYHEVQQERSEKQAQQKRLADLAAQR